MVLNTTYYQISSSDIRSIGAAQAASTLCFSLGTAAMLAYFDFSKDITVLTQAKAQAPSFLTDIARLWFWSWVVLWIIGVAAFLWQGIELHRIKAEHGEPTRWARFAHLMRSKSRDRG